MVDATLSISASKPVPASVSVPSAPPGPPSFGRQLLSEMNPLQYLPVVGTIYRAATGDTIPQPARMAGSLVISALTGGPIGIAMNVGTTLLEQLTGFDPEVMGERLLADLGIGGHHNSSAVATATPSTVKGSGSAPAVVTASATVPATVVAAGSDRVGATTPRNGEPGVQTSSARAWSPAQLAAYGVTTTASGTLSRGAVSGADVLNGLELARIGTASGSASAAAAV